VVIPGPRDLHPRPILQRSWIYRKYIYREDAKDAKGNMVSGFTQVARMLLEHSSLRLCGKKRISRNEELIIAYCLKENQ
jgi:hypothetical protein